MCCKTLGRYKSCVGGLSASMCEEQPDYFLTWSHTGPRSPPLPPARPFSTSKRASSARRSPPHLVKAKYMRLTMVKLSRVMVCGR